VEGRAAAHHVPAVSVTPSPLARARDVVTARPRRRDPAGPGVTTADVTRFSPSPPIVTDVTEEEGRSRKRDDRGHESQFRPAGDNRGQGPVRD